MDLGGKLTSGKPYWRNFGAKFGNFVGDVEAKSGYGIYHMICQILFGHVICCWICVPKCSPPETPRFEVGFGELCFIHLGVTCKDGSNILGPDWGQAWPSWALLRYLEATATYASWGKVGGS